MDHQNRVEKRRQATIFVERVNRLLVCAECGKSPIEWHRDVHKEHSNWRVSSLRTQGASVSRIKEEMRLCVPLCRSCHMIVDGRLEEFLRNAPRPKGSTFVPKLPCNCCERLAKPLRRGMCTGCYNHHQGLRRRKTRSCDGCCFIETKVTE